MNIAIINGTNRINNKTVLISKTVEILIKKLGHTTHLLTLDYFDSLFRGKYIDYASANKNQKKQLIKPILFFFIFIFTKM